MQSTTAYRQGDIVLVPFPFTDLSSAKKRPGVVVSPDPFNRLSQDVILVAITSHFTTDEDVTVIADADFLEGRLPQRSAIKLAKIFTIHSSLVLRRIGALKRAKTEEILERLRQLFSS